jgi:hypothetical protein
VRRLALLLTTALCLAGCGFGAGEEREGGAELRITRDFGRELLSRARTTTLREGDTVMRFLRRERDIETRFGGGFVQSIDGLEGAGPTRSEDWFFFVNGIESGVGAAEYELSAGDRVQWDYRNWEAAMRIPAIVGAFPEPLLNGVEGKRRAVRVECEDSESRACETAKDRLGDAGVTVSGSSLGASGTENVIRVVVGRWRAVRIVQHLAEIEDGPADSGVFARFDEEGTRLELLDEEGRSAETAPAGTGLVAATAPSDREIVWAVTAADERGVERAAAALDPSLLGGAFAVAVTPAGPEKLPLGAE